MTTPQDLPRQATKAHAVDLVNEFLQRLIEVVEQECNQELALELGNIKYQVQQRYERERRNEG